MTINEKDLVSDGAKENYSIVFGFLNSKLTGGTGVKRTAMPLKIDQNAAGESVVLTKVWWGDDESKARELNLNINQFLAAFQPKASPAGVAWNDQPDAGFLDARSPTSLVTLEAWADVRDFLKATLFLGVTDEGPGTPNWNWHDLRGVFASAGFEGITPNSTAAQTAAAAGALQMRLEECGDSEAVHASVQEMNQLAGITSQCYTTAAGNILSTVVLCSLDALAGEQASGDIQPSAAGVADGPPAGKRKRSANGGAQAQEGSRGSN